MDKVIKYLMNDLKLKDKDIIVIGNSAGPDSMALTDILLKLREKIDIKIICAHVNHNVRKESKEEAIFLKEYCEENDIIFIDAAKGKYPIFLKEAIRLSHKNTIILADNILYKGYVMSDYNKHKQRTAVTHLREYIKEATEDKSLETKILEVGDGLAISKVLI